MKIAEASVDLIVLKCVICDVNAYTVTVFCVAQHESGARNDSVTVYSFAPLQMTAPNFA